MCCCGGTRRSWCVGVTVGTEVNRGLMFLQDLACRGSLKQFLMAAIGLWLAAMIGSCCNFLTVLYIGFVGAGGVFVCIFLWRIMLGLLALSLVSLRVWLSTASLFSPLLLSHLL
ncbi:reticulon-like protein B8 [Brassica napus]|uniref:reticulon-like protein B8 n=1 Tax=Brassica napus TaxID=3708 RepID=UPI0020786584|nr:reticulon-like protein B8 [Brassica napus]